MPDHKDRKSDQGSDAEIIRLEDLAPRKDVTGGSKLKFGEPASRKPPKGRTK
jgi:hypothetical protein